MYDFDFKKNWDSLDQKHRLVAELEVSYQNKDQRYSTNCDLKNL